MDQPDFIAERRPVASRQRPIWIATAHWLARRGVSANSISLAGMLACILAGLAFKATTCWPSFARPLWLLGGVCVQLRLLANMLDGMVAVDSGKASRVGALYNEVPDRISDVAVFLGLGYAANSSPELGYLAAIAAVFVAYVRAAARAAGAPEDYCGPMAKPQRMFVVTVLALYCAVTPAAWQILPSVNPQLAWGVPKLTLAMIFVGSSITALRRVLRAARALQGNAV